MSNAIDESLVHSYQYNLKIIGVPQVNGRETAAQTTELCLAIFKAIGANVNINDVDIAHQVPSRKSFNENPNGRAEQRNCPIICKFTRRLVENDVFEKRKNLNVLAPKD